MVFAQYLSLPDDYKYDYSVYMGVTPIACLLWSLLAHRPPERHLHYMSKPTQLSLISLFPLALK